MKDERVFRLNLPLTAVKRLDATRFEIATLPADTVVVYRGEFTAGKMAQVNCAGEVYGVFLCDLELRSTEVADE